jgi:hypothetical protein
MLARLLAISRPSSRVFWPALRELALAARLRLLDGESAEAAQNGEDDTQRHWRVQVRWAVGITAESD